MVASSTISTMRTPVPLWRRRPTRGDGDGILKVVVAVM
jgi:hypothetical protein